MKPKLIQHANTLYYSQNGEEGILEVILDRIGTTNKVCLEVGAHDGLHCANTAYLWKYRGWKGVLIEGNPDHFDALRANASGYDTVVIERYIEPTGEHSIDGLLTQHGLEEPLDVVCIDIDGDDYYMFEGLSRKHRVVIVEHNPTFPAYLDIYQARGEYVGCSVGALNRLAKAKGYTLVAITHCNAIFVADECVGALSDYETDLTAIMPHHALTYIIETYDGHYKVIGDMNCYPYGLVGEYERQLHGNFHEFQVTVVRKNPQHHKHHDE